MHTQSTPPVATDEVSIKELFLKIKEWVAYFKTQWQILVFVGVLSASVSFLYAYLQKPIYTATLSFALDDEKSSGGGIVGALGLANSLGFDLGSGSVSGAFSGANLLELMKSRSLVEKTLLQPITVKGKTISLATYYMKMTEMNKDMGKTFFLTSDLFPPLANRSTFSLQQDSLLGIMYHQIVGKNGLLSVAQKDKKISILSIDVKSKDELFSKNFAEKLAIVVSTFYIETKSKKAKLNYEILQKQTDSIRNELNMAISGMAEANDLTYNLNPALNRLRTPSARKQIDVQANTAILTQLVSNLEMAKVGLRKETPLIQIIDTPILPLPKEKISKMKITIGGGFLGFFIYIIFLVLRKLMRDWML
ncbi:MAG: hypothetical protein KGZ74_01145 [Chitinophagaceae bacterium]|nr:hypothetical protein [Chitinophagaceae bacterium]